LAKRKAKKGSVPKATVESKDTVEEPQDESCKEAENEVCFRIFEFDSTPASLFSQEVCIGLFTTLMFTFSGTPFKNVIFLASAVICFFLFVFFVSCYVA